MTQTVVDTGAGDADDLDLIERLVASGLRGRGGGWFPAGAKWRAVHVEGGAPAVVANGAEGEPGSIKDRHIMLTRPGEVLEGVALACRALGAREAVVYLKGYFARSAAALEDALRARPVEGADVRIVRGENGYIVGEETALLESLEGRRAWPRPKPPLPASVGLAGRPTLVQNVDTLARVPAAIRDPEAHRTKPTLLVSLWGHVRRPGAYEVPLGTPLRTLVEVHGGGAPDGVGMIFPAGPSAAPLGPEGLDATLDPDALRAAGSGLGTGAVLVVGRSACPLAVASSLAGFFERESCGQCPPCRLGTTNVARIVRGVEGGATRAKELSDLREVADFMASHGYCAHGRTAAGAITGLLTRFRESVEEHVREGRCPRPEIPSDPFGIGSPEWTAIEATLGS